MSYLLEKFGSTTLPQAVATYDIGTAEAYNGIVPIGGGGGYDTFGANDAPLKPLTILHRCRLYDPTATTLQTTFDALKALAGQQDTLTRLMPNASEQTIAAECISVKGQRVPGNVHHFDIEMIFASAKSYWNGAIHDSTTVALPASGNVVINNGGNCQVTIPIFQFVAAGSTITGITMIKTGQTSLKFAGSLAAGADLIVDCGAYTVLNNGTDNFDNWTRETAHIIPEWVRLDPGDNTFALTRTGGNSSSNFVYFFYDGWK